MRYAVLLDFGSTYTKVVCVDLPERKIVLTQKFASTVQTDARICMQRCFDAAIACIGEKEFQSAIKLSSSSAAGGLRMAVVGLSRTLSYTAGKNVVYGAGAKIMTDYYGLLTEEAIRNIESKATEIIMLCGGYEGGNRESLIYNAEKLAESDISVPVIYAGNSDVATDVRTILRKAGKECFLAKNIMPEIGVIQSSGAEDLIRQIFMKRIVNMKGLSQVQSVLGEVLMPTPAAVLTAGTLLSNGTAHQPGLGEMMIVDIGGATTDVYSFCDNHSYDGAKLIGVQEPYAKRTVEGDMGMRESSVCIRDEVGITSLATRAGVTEEYMQQAIEKRLENIAYLPDCEEQRKIDDELARSAISVSVRRHAGHIEYVTTGGGAQHQIGKNLTGIDTVIGTGGIIVNNANPKGIIESLCLQPGEMDTILVPRKIQALVDKDYVLFAAGLLSSIDEEAALTIMKSSIN